MKIVMLSGVCLSKGVDALPMEVHDVVDPLGRRLITRAKARLFDPTKDQEAQLESLNATALLEFAAKERLGLDGMRPQEGKARILEAVKAALAARG